MRIPPVRIRAGTICSPRGIRYAAELFISDVKIFMILADKSPIVMESW
jgi:hypothetical protein